MAQRRRTARRRKASQGPALKRCLPVLAGLALAVLALFGVLYAIEARRRVVM